jgi:hypothetical protein
MEYFLHANVLVPVREDSAQHVIDAGEQEINVVHCRPITKPFSRFLCYELDS